ncbi:MAG: hypothetical protein V1738_02975 [Patescibacteria group bacterium]
MQPKEAIARLRRLVRQLVTDRVVDRPTFKVWKKANAEFVADCLDYYAQPGQPAAHDCLDADFHPDLPLIILNYTGVAHNTLHNFERGWTLPLMFARGIRFTRRGALNALPFPKFHNYGQLTTPFVPPVGPIEVTEKLDGHCLIISYCGDQLIVATRGRFMSPTAILARPILQEFAAVNQWSKIFPRDHTVICELIHPETRVHVDYFGQVSFPLIGAMSHRRAGDYDYSALRQLGQRLNLPIVPSHSFSSVEQLARHLGDTTIENREGFVARFADGTRLKFKFDTYLRLMFENKLSRVWVMHRLMAGNLDDALPVLSADQAELARRYAADALAVCQFVGTPKERWRFLYGAVPAEDGTPNYRATCRDFVRWLDQQEQQ